MRRGTNTIVAREIQSAEAKKEYADKSKSVKKLMDRLEKAMKKHEKDFSGEERNWGYVGDLGHIESELADLVRFLGG